MASRIASIARGTILLGPLLVLFYACSDEASSGPRPTDGGRPRDAAASDASKPAPPDAGLPEECPDGSVGFDQGVDAALIPLAEFCARQQCPSTLTAFTEHMRCVPYEAYDRRSPWDVFDGGPTMLWARAEGCGVVQLSSIGTMPWEFYEFDPESGAFRGGARIDDVGSPVPSAGCESAGVAAGPIKGRCDDAVLSLCEP